MIVLGGGVDHTQAIAREIPPLIEQIPVVYLRQRQADESFALFANRHTPEQLAALCDASKSTAGA